jgi:hypothetical protein
MKAEKKATSSANKKHAHSTTNYLQNSSHIQTAEIQVSASSINSSSTSTSRKLTRLQQQQKQMFNEAAVRNNFYV